MGNYFGRIRQANSYILKINKVIHLRKTEFIPQWDKFGLFLLIGKNVKKQELKCRSPPKILCLKVKNKYKGEKICLTKEKKKRNLI